MAFLGCIADDFTGATDLANNLVREGMRTVQVIGVPAAADLSGPWAVDGVADADAIVVALKSRTSPVEEAVKGSLTALSALRAAGCRRFFFKYCSTFDSTPAGNIGPVAEALRGQLDEPLAIAAPAFPATGRTVIHGDLLVNGVPLNESGMQNHPLTPMTDANLVRWLSAQSQGNVGLIDQATIDAGVGAIHERRDELIHNGVSLAVVDTVEDRHITLLGAAFADARLITGGSGIALGLPQPWRDAGLIDANQQAASLGDFGGAKAIVAGSCSERTQEQVAAFAEHHPALALDAVTMADDAEAAVRVAMTWAEARLDDGPVLIYSTATPDAVSTAQQKLGAAEVGALVEDVLARISQGLVAAGVRRLIVAGGETSGAVVEALGIQMLRIGPQIDPGVPWTAARPDLAIALKSGNFGAVDFFTRAFEVCP